MNDPKINRALLIPRRLKRANLEGLGDALDDYNQAVLDSSDAYNWLMRSKDVVYSVGSDDMRQSYQNLILQGEDLRQRVASFHLEPSIGGFIDSIFGGAFNIPGAGVIASSSQMTGLTQQLQNFIAYVEQLKLNVEQFQRMTKAGVSETDARNAIDQANMSLLDKVASAVKWPAVGIGVVLLVGALIIFSPEIKMGFKAIRGKVKS